MSEAQSIIDSLNQLLKTEARSLTHHLHEADAPPYLTARTYPIWRKIKAMIDVSSEHETRLKQLIKQAGGVPVTPTFRSPVAGFHYLNLPTLLPLLIEETSNKIAAYEQVLAESPADVSAELAALLEKNREQLQQLQSLLEQLPAQETEGYKP